MKTPEQKPIITYIQTARSISPNPVKIDRILEDRIKAFRRAKELNQAARATK